MICPPALCPGDRVAVIAPSGPFEPTLGWCGLGWLAERYRVEYRRDMFRATGYTAGTQGRRAEELRAAVADPELRAILAMRGGYGLHQVAHLVDWSPLAARPKWIVGFSDITVLHLEAARVGVLSLHAPMVALLGRGCATDRQLWLEAVEHPERERQWTGLSTLAAGRASGPLFGGNLTVLHASAVSGPLPVPPGAILLLEDIGERPYRVDRMLTTLILGKHLDRIAGVVLGEFTGCSPGSDGVSVLEVLREILGRLGIPVVAGLPVGHGLRNEPVILGAQATLEATEAGARFSLVACPSLAT